MNTNNNPSNSTGSPISHYTQLRPGNYWIYQYYEIDSMGNATPSAVFDSSFVEKDTVVNGFNYHKYCMVDLLDDSIIPYTFSFSLLRDSSGFTMGGPGYIFFTPSNLYDTLNYNVYINGTDTTSDLMELTDRDSLINVPAGNYLTINRKRTEIKSYSSNCGSSYRIHSTSIYCQRFAENIGKVLLSHKFNSDCQILAPDFWYEKRLVRYHVIH